MKEYIHIKPMPPETKCVVCDWPTEGLAKRLVSEMRKQHPDGVDMCLDCLDRAKVDMGSQRGVVP